MKIYIIVVISLLLFSCETKNKSRDVDSDYQISVSWDEIEQAKGMPFDLIFDSVEVVKTPSVDKIPLRNIDRIISAGKYMAAITMDALVVMDRNDTVSYIYNRIGRGPGEYENLEDILYDEKNNRLLVLTGYPNRILTLSMQCDYISQYSLPTDIMWERMYFRQNELYLFGEDYNQKTKEGWDIISKCVNNELSAPVKICKRRGHASSRYWEIGESRNRLMLGICYRDSIFSVSDTLSVTPLKVLFKHEKEVRINKSLTHQMLFINDSMAIFARAAHKDDLNYIKYFLYDLSAKRSSVYLYLDYIGAHPVGFDAENMYAVIYPASRRYLVEEEEKIDKQTRRIYKDLFKYLREGNEMDNPILVRFHVKE